MRAFRQNLLLGSMLIFMWPLAAEPADSQSMFYRVELNARFGYHMFSDSNQWVSSKQKMIEDDIFFKSDPNYSSSNVSSLDIPQGGGMPFLSMEILFGINFKNAPILKKIEDLHSFRGFRTGGGMTLYPLVSRPVYSYDGPVVYNLANPPTGQPAQYSYNGHLNISDDFFMLVNYLSFYYYHEKGIKSPDFKPYGGLEIGMAILSGKRKLSFKTDDLQVAGTSSYTSRVEANIQENFFDELALRLGFTAGMQIHLHGAHFLDLRTGYYLQSSNLDLVRRGNWNEYRTGSNPDANYTQNIKELSRAVEWNQSGFFVTLGYTVGLK